MDPDLISDLKNRGWVLFLLILEVAQVHLTGIYLFIQIFKTFLPDYVDPEAVISALSTTILTFLQRQWRILRMYLPLLSSFPLDNSLECHKYCIWLTFSVFFPSWESNSKKQRFFFSFGYSIQGDRTPLTVTLPFG